MNTQQARQQIIALWQQGKEYAALDVGWRYLATVPDDAEITELVLGGLLDVGLGGLVRELLQLRRDLDQQAAKKWQAAADAAPAGRVPWAELADTYRANLALLIARHPHLAEQEQALEQSLRGLHLYRTTDGHHLLSRRKAGHYREWLPAITDHRHDVELELPKLRHGTPVFIDGISLGPMVERVFDATASIGLNQSLPVFLVDEELSHLTAWLHLADRSKQLADERFFVFCGARALDDLVEFLDGHDDLASAPCCAITPPGFAALRDKVMSLHAGVLLRRQNAFLEIMEQLKDRYAERDVDYWRARVQDKGPVIAVTSRATTMLQYSARDIGHALEEMGYDFHLLIEAADHLQLTGLQVVRHILEVDPVLCVLIDHLRCEQNKLLFNIPTLTWVQDPLPNLLNAQAGASIGPLDFVCGYYQDRLVSEFGYPESQFIVAPFPVSTRAFHADPVATDHELEYDCDIVYVGHMPGTMESHFAKWHGDSPAEFGPFLQIIYDRVKNVLESGAHMTLPALFLRGIVDEFGARMGEKEFENLAYAFAYRLFDLGYRQQTLSWVGKWAERTGRRFRIYGRDWENHSELGGFAAGPIAHGEPLRRLYCSTPLVLQCIPGGFMHQRSYEAIACGALVLVRFSPKDFYQVSVEEWTRRTEAGEFLDSAATTFPGLANLVFHNADEFEKLAEQYLQDRNARERALAPIRDVVLGKYTYASVMQRIMNEIKQRLGTAEPVAAAR
ncbi:MAG: glycosyltransferase family 1 protein [Planctomycetes bacterium]|nr:glycosyltransferase family 1 protein [Planctomycetota bacterium]